MARAPMASLWRVGGISPPSHSNSVAGGPLSWHLGSSAGKDDDELGGAALGRAGSWTSSTCSTSIRVGDGEAGQHRDDKEASGGTLLASNGGPLCIFFVSRKGFPHIGHINICLEILFPHAVVCPGVK
uniref:Uncharacterized protein n=1 Tax=Arundo donax TaxID=35708 RepID=A0A0A8YZL4_ARUDO